MHLAMQQTSLRVVTKLETGWMAILPTCRATIDRRFPFELNPRNNANLREVPVAADSALATSTKVDALLLVLLVLIVASKKVVAGEIPGAALRWDRGELPVFHARPLAVAAGMASRANSLSSMEGELTWSAHPQVIASLGVRRQ